MAHQLTQMFICAFAGGVAAGIEGMSRLSGQTFTSEHFEPLTWATAERGRQLSAADYLLAQEGIQLISRQMGRFMTDFDVWLTPTLAEPPLPLGTFDLTLEEFQEHGEDRVLSFMPFTPICNVTGLPGMSVPLFWNADGLPIGSHFIGRFGDEGTLFRLAAQLETARPWMEHRPPVCA